MATKNKVTIKGMNGALTLIDKTIILEGNTWQKRQGANQRIHVKAVDKIIFKPAKALTYGQITITVIVDDPDVEHDDHKIKRIYTIDFFNVNKNKEAEKVVEIIKNFKDTTDSKAQKIIESKTGKEDMSKEEFINMLRELGT